MVRSPSRRHGFSLIETLVAVSLFSIFLLIIIGIFSRFVFTQRRDIGEIKLQEDLRLAIELINREIRTGFGNTFAGGDDQIYFRNQAGTCVSYQWEQGRQVLRRAEVVVTGTNSCATNYPEESFRVVTSNTTAISQVIFRVKPATVDGERLSSQGLIVMTVKAFSKQKSNKEVFMQSAVASRQINPYHSQP